MAETLQAVLTYRSGASAEQIYDAWLTAEQIRAWQPYALKSMGLTGDGVRVETDPRVGGAFVWADMREGIESRCSGIYLELERPSKIRYTWVYDYGDEHDESEVGIEIRPDPGGGSCVVTLTHDLDPRWADYVDQCTGSWRRMLEAVETMLNAD
jgi:uncharacterized protein YndB with AHSA1/START domain